MPGKELLQKMHQDISRQLFYPPWPDSIIVITYKTNHSEYSGRRKNQVCQFIKRILGNNYFIRYQINYLIFYQDYSSIKVSISFESYQIFHIPHFKFK